MKHVILLAAVLITSASSLSARAEVPVEQCGLNRGYVALKYRIAGLANHLSPASNMTLNFTDSPVGIEIFKDAGDDMHYRLDLEGLTMNKQFYGTLSDDMGTYVCVNDPSKCDVWRIKRELDMAKSYYAPGHFWWQRSGEEQKIEREAIDCASKLVSNFAKRLKLNPVEVRGVEVSEPASVPSSR